MEQGKVAHILGQIIAQNTKKMRNLKTCVHLLKADSYPLATSSRETNNDWYLDARHLKQVIPVNYWYNNHTCIYMYSVLLKQRHHI